MIIYNSSITGIEHTPNYTAFDSDHTLLLYEVHTISFQTFFVWAFKIVIDS